MEDGIQVTGRDDGVVDGKRRLFFSVVVEGGVLEVPEALAKEETGVPLCGELRASLHLAVREFISRGYKNLERIVSLREQDFEPAFTKKEKEPWNEK